MKRFDYIIKHDVYTIYSHGTYLISITLKISIYGTINQCRFHWYTHCTIDKTGYCSQTEFYKVTHNGIDSHCNNNL